MAPDGSELVPIIWDEPLDPATDESWIPIHNSLRSRTAEFRDGVPAKGRNPIRLTDQLVDTIRAIGKTPNGRVAAQTGNVGRGLFQAVGALNNGPVEKRAGQLSEHNSAANRARNLVRDGLLKIYKRDGVGNHYPAVLFVATNAFWEVHATLDPEPEKKPNTIELDTGKGLTDYFVEAWHDRFHTYAPYPATRKGTPWDAVPASWQTIKSILPDPLGSQFRIVRQTPITPRADLKKYYGRNGLNIGDVFDEMAANQEPLSGDHIEQSLAFLEELDLEAVVGWLRNEAAKDTRRDQLVDKVMLADGPKSEKILALIDGIWPGRSNGKRRRNAYEAIRLLAAEIIQDLISKRAGMILLTSKIHDE